jgi:prepilin-type N-terminal cleavage/methylation domain-containing protein
MPKIRSDRTQKENSAAFTLVELLVVIAIIALLLSILMPSLTKARMSAKAIVCQSHLQTWALAFTMYTQENRSLFPALMAGAGGKYGQWTISLKPYYGNETKVWFCPMARRPTTSGGGQPFAAWVVSEDAAGNPRPGDYGSYGVNAWIYSRTEVYEGFPHQNTWKTTNVRGANNIPIFGDCMWRGGFPEDDDIPQSSQTDWFVDDSQSLCYFNMNRHDTAMNMLFMDSSIRRVPLKQLWRLKWNRVFDTSKPFPAWPKWMAKFPEGSD